MHFTEYPPNPAYLEFDLKTILIADPLSRTRYTKYIGCEGKWYEVLPLLFKDKYNYLPAYFFPMTLPLTPQPDRPMEPPTTVKTTSTQLFGALLTGPVVPCSESPNASAYACLPDTLGNKISYLMKLGVSNDILILILNTRQIQELNHGPQKIQAASQEGQWAV
ncbi:hypothetical protein DSO57_1022642 [Entomophthora muscae]|uniref:Uncharacterized protein n=1 Tax=Entomophthora muscae TaxID=34485 RepID=A0ACC2SGC3_9FUNG|nr:hypothetical protein DSO57_1022642 [Entomophthora muscae]